MSYFAHLQRAFRIGGALSSAGAACFVHGLMPGLFTTKATRTIIRLSEEVAAVPPHGGQQTMWLEFEI
jgi:hypothetical protein